MTKPRTETADPAFPRRKEKMAKSEALSERGAENQPPRTVGETEKKPDLAPIGHELDHFMGLWTETEERDFLKAIEPLGQVDEEMWDFGTVDDF